LIYIPINFRFRKVFGCAVEVSKGGIEEVDMGAGKVKMFSDGVCVYRRRGLDTAHIANILTSCNTHAPFSILLFSSTSCSGRKGRRRSSSCQ